MKQVVHNAVVLAAAAQADAALNVLAYDELAVAGRMDAAAAADLVVEVRPYEPDGVTLFDQELPIVSQQAAVLSGGVSRLTKRYDVSAIEKVQVRVRNAGAAGHTAVVNAYLDSD